MARINQPTRKDKIYTHEGATAKHINPEMQLRRSVMACMLWESTFYEDGQSIADRIANIIPRVSEEVVADIAIEAREKMKLRHVPLLLARVLAKNGYTGTGRLLSRIIQRPDELTEFLSIYWRDGRQPLSAQVKKGLAQAFTKFDRYQLSKYNRKDAVKLRDVMFLTHPKPKDDEQAKNWKDLVDDNLEPPETWEVALSAGKDKKESWEKLLKENKLGALALLRNLRNMKEADVEEQLIFNALENMKVERILPFRFISAAKYTPQWEDKIEKAMMKCLTSQEKLSGKTALVIDGSSSMFRYPISSRSEINRFEAASTLGILLREICEDVVIVVFSNYAYLVPSRHGFALRDAIFDKAEREGTYTQDGIEKAAESKYDRIIVITDEQSHVSVFNPLVNTKGYFINVAIYKNGIGYGDWIHIDGWSEHVIEYIRQYEELQQ